MKRLVGAIILFELLLFSWTYAGDQNLSVNSLTELAELYTDGYIGGGADYDALEDGDTCDVKIAGEERKVTLYIYDVDSGQADDGSNYIAPLYVSAGVGYTGDARWVKMNQVVNKLYSRELLSDKQEGIAGDHGLYGAAGTSTNTAGMRGPDSITYSYRWKYPNVRPATTSIPLLSSQSSGAGTEADPYVHSYSYLSFLTDESSASSDSAVPSWGMVLRYLEGFDTGPGLPAGGTTGQMLLKQSATDGDASWGVGNPLSIDYTSTNYDPLAATLLGHLQGINAKLGEQEALVASLIAVIEAAGMDTTPPTLTRVLPANASVVIETDSLALRYTADDADGFTDANRMQWRIGEGSWNNYTNTAGTQYDDTATGFSVGANTVTTRATNNAGGFLEDEVSVFLADRVPTQFTFTDVTNADTSTVYTSNEITVAGINAEAEVSVSGGTYSKNGGAYTAEGGTCVLNDTFRVRQTSSSNPSTQTNTTLTIGGVSDTYSVTTGGSFALKWTGDHVSGTQYAEVSGGTLAGTWVGGAASSVQNHTSGGTYSGLFDANNEVLGWPVTNKDIISDTEGRLELWAYCPSLGSAGLWEHLNYSTQDTNNQIYAYLDPVGRVVFWHEGNNAARYMVSYNTITPEQWNVIRFRWSVANDIFSVKINDNPWENDYAASAIQATSVALPYLAIGERFSGAYATPVYIDDLLTYTTYDATWSNGTTANYFQEDFEGAERTWDTNCVDDCDGYDSSGDLCDDDTDAYAGVESLGIRGSYSYYAGTSIAAATDMSIEYYWKSTTNADAYSIGYYSSGAYYPIRVATSSTGHLRVYYQNGGAEYTATTNPLSADTWTRIRVYYKEETSEEANDGWIRAWVGDTLVIDRQGNVDTGIHPVIYVQMTGPATNHVGRFDNITVSQGALW